MLLTVRIFSTAGADDLASVCTATVMRAPEEALPARRAGRGFFSSRGLVASLGALRPVAVLIGVVLGRSGQQRADLVCHRLDVAAGLDPLRAVPFLHESGEVTIVVGAGCL